MFKASPILFTAVLTTSMMFAPSAHAVGGGGERGVVVVDPSERMPMNEVVESIKAARFLVLERLNYLEEIAGQRAVDAHPEQCLGIPSSGYERRSPSEQYEFDFRLRRFGYESFSASEPEGVNPPVYLPLLFQPSLNLRTFAQNLKIEIRETEPCRNSVNDERDGSIYSSVPGAICISAFTIQRTIPSNRLF